MEKADFTGIQVHTTGMMDGDDPWRRTHLLCGTMRRDRGTRNAMERTDACAAAGAAGGSCWAGTVRPLPAGLERRAGVLRGRTAAKTKVRAMPGPVRPGIQAGAADPSWAMAEPRRPSAPGVLWRRQGGHILPLAAAAPAGEHPGTAGASDAGD